MSHFPIMPVKDYDLEDGDLTGGIILRSTTFSPVPNTLTWLQLDVVERYQDDLRTSSSYLLTHDQALELALSLLEASDHITA